MTTKTMKLALAAVAVLGVGAATAQEMGAAPTASKETVPVAAAPAASTAQAALPIPVQDEAEKTIAAVEAGGKTLQEFQKEIGAEQKTYMGTEDKAKAEKLYKPASDLVVEKLHKIKKVGADGQEYALDERMWDEGSQSIIVIGNAEAVVDDPANDETFIDVRNIKALEAYLDAKAQIIRALEVQFDSSVRASTKIDTVPTNAETEAEKAFKETYDELEKKRNDLIEEMEELDTLKRQTSKVKSKKEISLQLGALLDGVVKEIDKVPPTDKLLKIKQDCKKLSDDIRELDKIAKNVRPVPVNEIEWEGTLYAQMPLLGANVLVQAESWEKSSGTYMISMAVVWSPKLQAQAVAVARGEFSASSNGKYSVNEWMNQQALECMVGPRRFVDDCGRYINLGIAAADMDCATTLRKGNRAIADTLAFNFVAFSLFGDVEAYREVKLHYNDYRDKWTQKEKATFAKRILDTVTNKAKGALRGCVPLSQFAARKYVHPISGHHMYVVPYHLSPTLAVAAKPLIKKSFEDAVRVSKQMNSDLGERAGQREAFKDARESTQDYNEGFAKGKKDINDAIKKDGKARRDGGHAAGAEGTLPAVKAPRKNKGGAYSGDNAVDTDF